jgi:hypothetical protein
MEMCSHSGIFGPIDNFHVADAPLRKGSVDGLLPHIAASIHAGAAGEQGCGDGESGAYKSSQ